MYMCNPDANRSARDFRSHRQGKRGLRAAKERSKDPQMPGAWASPGSNAPAPRDKKAKGREAASAKLLDL